MERVLSSDVHKHAGQEVMVQGWLHKKRVMGGLVFVVLRDRGGLVQIVVTDEKEQAKLQGLLNGTILDVSGTVKAEPRAAGGNVVDVPSWMIAQPLTHVGVFVRRIVIDDQVDLLAGRGTFLDHGIHS